MRRRQLCPCGSMLTRLMPWSKILQSIPHDWSRRCCTKEHALCGGKSGRAVRVTWITACLLVNIIWSLITVTLVFNKIFRAVIALRTRERADAGNRVSRSKWSIQCTFRGGMATVWSHERYATLSSILAMLFKYQHCMMFLSEERLLGMYATLFCLRTGDSVCTV